MKRMAINATLAVINVGVVDTCRRVYVEGAMPFTLAAVVSILAILSLPMYVSRFNRAYEEYRSDRD